MTRVIKFEGRTINVPDDFTDAEVAQVLAGGQQQSNSIGPAAVAQQSPGFAERLATPRMNDIAKSGATGMREGIEMTAGQFGDAAKMQGNIASWIAGKMGAGPDAQETARTWGGRATPAAMFPSTQDIRTAVTDPLVKATGTEDVLDHTPTSTAGEYARTGMQFLPAAASPGGAVRKIANVAVPALFSETAGQATKGTALEPYARAIAALLGGGAAMGGRGPAARATVEDLKGAGRTAYKAADAAGVVINRTGMNSLARNVVKDLTDHGFDPANEPGAMAALKRIQAGAAGNVTLKGLDTIRKVASNGYIPGNASNNKVISQIIARIDELVASNDPKLMAGIDTAAGTAALQAARKTWAQARKLETVEKFTRNGKAIGNSQINQDVEGATRRQVRTLLTNDAKARGFSPAELKAAEKAASMTPGMRALRATSGLLPQGKLGGIIHGTTALTSLASGNLPALLAQGAGMGIGALAKAGEGALSRRSMDKFVDLVANGGIPVKKGGLTQDQIVRLLMAAQNARIAASSHPVKQPDQP